MKLSRKGLSLHLLLAWGTEDGSNNKNLHDFLHNFVPCSENVQKQPPELFFQKGILRNFTKLTGKYLCQSLFFNKVAGLRLLKKRLWHRCFPVNFIKFLRTPFLQNISGRLLLNVRITFQEVSFVENLNTEVKATLIKRCF